MPQNTNSGLTLTDMTHLGRQGLKFGAILLVFLIVGRMVFTSFVAYWKATHPQPPPPPTMGFGLLPSIEFPAQGTEDKPSSYILETPTGRLPVYGDRAKVFFMPRSTSSLLADQRAKEIASQYGYVFEPEILDSQTYRWTKSQPIESLLELNIETLDLLIASDYLTRPELISAGNLPSAQGAIASVKGLLQSSGLLGEDIATASGEIVYLKAIGGELDEAVSFSDADFIQVDLNRFPIDGKYRMFTPEGYVGTVTAIVSGGLDTRNNVVDLKVRYQNVDYSQIETYPLRSPESAWQLLQAGEGYIANYGDGDEAIIREMYLGYFDSFEEQDYLQPIYVFEGDGGFLGYVPALNPSSYQLSAE